ncbi:AMP-dependent synthetase/ligase [Penicillium alfredii]|uniref:AMP-dependent synthetase/ligase n=1 Tax=Penicillium alfredii TaxID=1506179 RepID=A0A9W9GBE2_9EURO|nr:AMP-dependent synthetase/ligase [Penicillium alfredii]KAJ5115369.1 AMP-dependent synthetase/ligase [Penicillium alfredii]
MAPILFDSNHFDSSPAPAPIKPPIDVVPPSVVDLTLSQRPRHLLQLIEALDAPATVKEDHPDIQIQRLLQLAWVVTARAFASSTTLHLGEQYVKGQCFVGEAAGACSGPVAQVHLDPLDTVQGLLRHISSSLVSVSGNLANRHVSQDKDAGYNSTIVYQRLPATRISGQRSCMGRCQVCCPMPIADLEALEPYSAGLRIYIRHTPDDRLHAQLDVGETSVALPLATSLLHSFNQALLSLVELPSQSFGGVDICAPHDRDYLTRFTRLPAPAQDVLLHDLCLRHVKTTPDAPAVRSWDGDLTYYELNDLTSRLAHWLVGKGVGRGVFVACAFYKSTWAIVARLAILMAGGAYICVDAHDPPPYLASVLERTRMKIMLTSEGYAERFADRMEAQFEVSEASLQALPSLPGVVPCSTTRPTDPCVVLFTSGSTGKPKGIIQEHRSYASALTDYIRVMGMGPHSRLFQFDAYAFDISNNDFLAPLMAGGCCCVPTTSLSMEALMVDLNDLQANFMFVTPSVAIDIDPDRVPTLQTMCIGGEPVSDAVLSKWLHRVRVINQYGMGEVASLCAHNPNLCMGRGAVVGRPASGAIWIVSPDTPDQLMPVGAVGEVLVEGPHIARGYLDNVSGKAENFLASPPSWMAQLHTDRPPYRLYRSGDLGRYNHDGTVELIGRKDTMLKLDGARVEAGQVEYVLRQHLSTGDAAVVDVLGVVDGVSDPILGVYLYLANSPMNLDNGPVEDMQFRPISEHHAIHALTQRLTEAVRQSLPMYYVPSLFLLIDRLPRTKSKKTDRRKLHLLGQSYYVAHREELRDITVWPDWD